MDIYPDDKIQYLSRPTNFIKKCLNCGSIFITDKECEACGYQLKDPDLGPPVGEGSFYSIRDDFYSKQNIFEKIFMRHKGRKFKDYRNRLLHRFNSLIKGMESPWDDLNKWNYFHFELLELTKYLASFSSNEIILNRILNSIRNHPFFYEIKLATESGRKGQPRKELLSKKNKILATSFLITIFLILLAPMLIKWTH